MQIPLRLDTPPNMKLHGATAEMYHVNILKVATNEIGLRAEISFTTPLLVDFMLRH